MDAGVRSGVTSEEKAELIKLRKENAELRRANEILETQVRLFCGSGARPQTFLAVDYIDAFKDRFGVETPICRMLTRTPHPAPRRVRSRSWTTSFGRSPLSNLQPVITTRWHTPSIAQ